MNKDGYRLLVISLVIFYFLIFLVFFYASLLYNPFKAVVLSFFYALVCGIVTYIIIRKIIKKKTEAIKDGSNSVKKEEITEEFEKLYNDLYEEILAVEKIRKKNNGKFIKILVLISIFFVLFGMLKNRVYIISPLIHCLILLVLFGSWLLACRTVYLNKDGKEYLERYKENIISRFIQLLNNNLNYIPNPTNSEKIKEIYINSGFERDAFNVFKQDDYIEGYLKNDIFVRMSDLKIGIMTGSGKNSSYTQLFEGLFVFGDFDKNLGTEIKIKRNTKKYLYDKNRIEIDSLEFEKYFDVFADNRIIAMKILTHDIMESLIKFYKRYQLDFEIILKDNQLYLRFFTDAMFEPGISENSLKKESFFYYYCILKFVLKITEDIIYEILIEKEI